MEESTDLNLGKVTAKFAVKFILWTLLFFVIGCVIVFMAFGSGMTSIDEDDMDAMTGAIKGFIYGLVVVDIIAAFLATKLSVGSITKKENVTADNKQVILKKMSIVMVVVAIIVLIIHGIIVSSVKNIIVEEIDDSYDSVSEIIKKAEEDLEDEKYSIFSEDEIEDSISALKAINFAGNVYTIVGLVYAAMIPFANSLLKKEIENK